MRTGTAGLEAAQAASCCSSVAAVASGELQQSLLPLPVSLSLVCERLCHRHPLQCQV